MLFCVSMKSSRSTSRIPITCIPRTFRTASRTVCTRICPNSRLRFHCCSASLYLSAHSTPFSSFSCPPSSSLIYWFSRFYFPLLKFIFALGQFLGASLKFRLHEIFTQIYENWFLDHAQSRSTIYNYQLENLSTCLFDRIGLPNRAIKVHLSRWSDRHLLLSLQLLSFLRCTTFLLSYLWKFFLSQTVIHRFHSYITIRMLYFTCMKSISFIYNRLFEFSFHLR